MAMNALVLPFIPLHLPFEERGDVHAVLVPGDRSGIPAVSDSVSSNICTDCYRGRACLPPSIFR